MDEHAVEVEENEYGDYGDEAGCHFAGFHTTLGHGGLR